MSERPPEAEAAETGELPPATTGRGNTPPDRVDGQSLGALAGAFLTQGAAAFGFIGYSLLAPGLAEATGLPERDFGLAFSFIFAGTALASPLSGAMMRRFGSVGTMAITLGGMALFALIALFGTWPAVMASAFIYGLFYGPYGPANITVVTRRTPHHRVGLFLSIRQCGVSLAGAGGGFLLPGLLLAVGWQAGVWAMTIVLGLALIATLAAAPIFRVEAEVTRPHTGPRPPLVHRIVNRLILPSNLRLLGWISISLAVMHTTLFTFVYIYLLEVVGLSPVVAGQFFAIIQLTAILGRPLMGWISDRTGNPETVLIGIAITASIAVAAVITTDASTPIWFIYVIAFVAGISGNSWSPIFAMIVGRRAPPGELAEITGRAYSLAAMGWTLSPLIMWSLIELSGGYTLPFAAVAVLGCIASLALVRDRAQITRTP